MNERRYSKRARRFRPSRWARAALLLTGGMTVARLDAILARQLPDATKRERADFVIDTGGSLDQTRAQVNAILACLGLGAAR